VIFETGNFATECRHFTFWGWKCEKFRQRKRLATGLCIYHDRWPKWTSAHQHTMQDGWCWDRKHFSLHSCLLANPGGKLWSTHPHASTYPVSTICLTYLLFTYFYIQAPKLQEQNHTFSNWV
jgi:hypothetical protein